MNKAIIYSHNVEFDEKNKKIVIYRVFPSGEKQLYTEIEVPNKKFDEGEWFSEYARIFGENIILDSPIGRRLLGFD